MHCDARCKRDAKAHRPRLPNKTFVFIVLDWIIHLDFLIVQTNKQTDRQTDRQTESESCACFSLRYSTACIICKNNWKCSHLQCIVARHSTDVISPLYLLFGATAKAFGTLFGSDFHCSPRSLLCRFEVSGMLLFVYTYKRARTCAYMHTLHTDLQQHVHLILMF